MLRRQRLELEGDLRRIPSSRDRQLELMKHESAISSLDNKKTHLLSELERSRTQKENKVKEAKIAMEQMEKLEPELGEAEAELEARGRQIQEIQNKIDKIADRYAPDSLNFA